MGVWFIASVRLVHYFDCGFRRVMDCSRLLRCVEVVVGFTEEVSLPEALLKHENHRVDLWRCIWNDWGNPLFMLTMLEEEECDYVLRHLADLCLSVYAELLDFNTFLLKFYHNCETFSPVHRIPSNELLAHIFYLSFSLLRQFSNFILVYPNNDLLAELINCFKSTLAHRMHQSLPLMDLTIAQHSLQDCLRIDSYHSFCPSQCPSEALPLR